jgi:hypothetical protein
MKVYPPNFLDHDQNSPEWLKARAGHVTASRVADVIATRKRGEGELAARKRYRRELLAEILRGRSADHFVTEAMQFGLDNEPLARTAYEMETGYIVERCGFVLHPRIDRCGASPDGLVGDVGGVEIKVPETETFIEWKIAGVVPEEHKPQMFLNMACCERGKPVEWWDFFAHDPRLADGVNSFLVRLPRDDKYIADMEAKIEQFLVELLADADRFVSGQSLEEKLRQSVKQAGKYTDDEMMAMLRDEGISVP